MRNQPRITWQDVIVGCLLTIIAISVTFALYLASPSKTPTVWESHEYGGDAR